MHKFWLGNKVKEFEIHAAVNINITDYTLITNLMH